jgi:uncharacterized protein (DUF58 family)
MKDRISPAVFWCAIGLIIGSLASLRLPVWAVVVAGAVIVLACLAEHFGWFRRRSGKRSLPRSRARGRSSLKQVKKIKA